MNCFNYHSYDNIYNILTINSQPGSGLPISFPAKYLDLPF